MKKECLKRKCSEEEWQRIMESAEKELAINSQRKQQLEVDWNPGMDVSWRVIIEEAEELKAA